MAEGLQDEALERWESLRAEAEAAEQEEADAPEA